jgi:ATP-dependent exoDNAse (exonuclease V) beta subunit
MTTWSYSSLKTFEQCAKKYYHLKVLKDVKDEGSEATIYGNEAHKAAEDYVSAGTPLPARFSYMQKTLDALLAIPGEKYCELKLGVELSDTGYLPCDFFGEEVWWRGIADLLIINEDIGYLVDYKTSKNAKYADTKQLDILAAAVFTRFPELRKLKSALAFVVSNEFVKKEHTSDLRKSYFATFTPELDRLSVAEDTGVWNANSGPLCKFCPVTTCEHNRR